MQYVTLMYCSLIYSADKNEMTYCSNRGKADICTLDSGVYGLSNASLDSPWFKVTEGKKKFEQIIKHFPTEQAELTSQLIELLNDCTK